MDASLDSAAGTGGTANDGGGSGGADGGGPCTSNDGCVGNPAGPICDVATGECVACETTDPGSCPVGQYCVPGSLVCLAGCDTQEDCAAGSDAVVCDESTHTCVGCLNDDQCPPGLICQANSCQPGCTILHDCPSGLACCGNTCVNTGTDPANCGDCDTHCQIANATAMCAGGTCALEACGADFANCDDNPANGCETPIVGGVGCVCAPGEVKDCYSGAATTKGIGACVGGQTTCADTGTGWGPCVGEVLPSDETCFTAVDDDCDGNVNEDGTGCICTPDATEACYTGSAQTQNIGACKDGSHTCNAMGTEWSACVGEVLPVDETCLTLFDDDCDGEINEDGALDCQCTPNDTQPCYGGPAGTQGIGVCQAGTQTCNAGGSGWGACQGEVLPSPDVCTDGLDNDCNGAVNDGFGAGATGCVCQPLATSSCYPGPAGTVGIGVCKPGTAVCNAQGTVLGACTGMVVPSPDHCTDALDNDCNGIVNDGVGQGGVGCTCTPNTQQSCYTGPNGTVGTGVCKAGTATCNTQGTGIGTCVGQVLPTTDHCTDNLDNDCNGILNDGFAVGGQGCVCTPATQQPCYTGPSGTLGVGVCDSGVATCAVDGKSWMPCLGDVVPSLDGCLDGLDNDCNGVADDGNHTAPGCACTPGEVKCLGNDLKKVCNSVGDWGPPEVGCQCTTGQFGCNCNQVLQCSGDKWVPKTPALSCNAAAGQKCDAATGTCKTLTALGTTTPTGTYYRYANFTSSNSALKITGNVDDIDSYGDRLYVNRGPWYSQGIAMDVYQVTLLDSDGDGKLEPNQHPSNPDEPGPIEQRVLTFIQSYTAAAPDNVPLGIAHRGEFWATSDRIYMASYPNTGDIKEYIFATKTSTVVAHSVASFSLSMIGRGDQDQKWYGGNESARRVYSYCPASQAWMAEFMYPNLAGSHMDGLEVIVSPKTGVQYVYVSDMTSDFLGQYRKTATGDWIQENLFQYQDVSGASVEGMGFGALGHFWIASGNSVYEIGGGDLTQYVGE